MRPSSHASPRPTPSARPAVPLARERDSNHRSRLQLRFTTRETVPHTPHRIEGECGARARDARRAESTRTTLRDARVDRRVDERVFSCISRRLVARERRVDRVLASIHPSIGSVGRLRRVGDLSTIGDWRRFIRFNSLVRSSSRLAFSTKARGGDGSDGDRGIVDRREG